MNRRITALPRQPRQAPETDTATSDNDSIRTARGFAIGIIVSLPVWALIAWMVWSIA
ncbi:MAG: hypothetical protein P4L71_04610 [Acetobacteraceae bacterium]|nr:hypothetical protein [Acetobacteraceae bacterium]